MNVSVVLGLLLTVLTQCRWSHQATVNSSSRKNPLYGDDGRRHLRPTECQFGKSIKELGSTWFADLGPPFGVMYCIKCECIAIQKKRRIVARVQCRNILNECPKPSCNEPVLQPHRCCKVCPGDDYSPDIVHDNPAPEEDKNMKHFGALLTGKTSLVFKRDDIINIPSTSKSPTFQIVATGRFTFHKKHLFFSFYITNSLHQIPPRPRTIQFINYKGDLLAEQALSVSSVYENSTTKICGVWRRIPKQYKRLLREDALYVALLWGNDLALSGQISRFKALNTEQFSALLSPNYSNLMVPDYGATAIITTLASPPSIHVSLVFNGLFTPTEVSHVPLTVRMKSVDEGQVVFEEIIYIDKPTTELNFGEIRLPISNTDLRLLSRGRLRISISSNSKPDFLFISGPVATRVTCELFQTCLAPATEGEGIVGVQETTLMSPPSSTSGLTWLYLNRDGSLEYNIYVDETKDHPTFSLVSAKGKKWVDIQHFTAGPPVNGWIHGTLDKLSLKALELLYSGDLAINMTSQKSQGIVRGQLVNRPVGDVVDVSVPMLLKRPDPTLSVDVVGMAWALIDYDCELHYDIQLSNRAIDQSYQLYLEHTPMLAPGAPVSSRLLEEFNGTALEGFVQLTTEELARMESGISFLQVRDSRNERILLKTNLKQIKIPVECLPHSTDNDVPSYISSGSSPSLVPEVSKCYQEDRFYDEGTQWKHPRDPCKMCHCLRGKESCDQVVCPNLSCATKYTPQPGECCPSCHNSTGESNTSSGCWLAGQFHPPGSSWHPYLPPNGFNLCTVITCEANTNSLRYSRVTCPPLTCPEREAVRLDKNSCCKTCPVPEVGFAQDQYVQQEVTVQKSNEQILKEGGCMHLDRGPFANNSDWTHYIPTIGPIPCVTCHCRNGSVSCGRIKCVRSCAQTNLLFDSHTMDECCISHCKRIRRQNKHRQQQETRSRTHQKVTV